MASGTAAGVEHPHPGPVDPRHRDAEAGLISRGPGLVGEEHAIAGQKLPPPAAEIGIARRSHIARQKQIHHLRHIIRELSKKFPQKMRDLPDVKELASWGCNTTMHVARLVAPKLDGEDHTKDIDFTPAGIRARWRAGYGDTKRMLEAAPWRAPVNPIDGVVIHDDPRVRAKIARGNDGFSGKTH